MTECLCNYIDQQNNRVFKENLQSEVDSHRWLVALECAVDEPKSDGKGRHLSLLEKTTTTTTVTTTVAETTTNQQQQQEQQQ